ncbi:MAG TPA: hypothetical protein VNJ08_05990 [Bacteriovoracaceae bacterium]|nr:hypothetical protein [Bacteriovoracaceae bacterium]
MIFLKIISLLLCLCFTTQGLKAQVQISPDEMQKLLSNPEIRRSHFLLAQQETPEKKKKTKEEEEKEKDENDHVGNVFGNLNLGGGGGNSEAAVIVFAIVGLVIIVAWIPIFPILAYQAATGKRDLEKVHHLSLQHILAGKYGHGSTSGENESLRYGSFIGGRYSLYLKDPKEVNSIATLGFSAELGHYRFKDKSQLGSNQVEGGYWMLGPSMLFGESNGGGFPLFAKIDLLAGSSVDADLGLVTRADLSVGSYLFGTNTSLGLGLGALYLHSKKSHGILNNGEELGLIFSGNVGYSF